ncbi:hypothetical protein AURDEDRAFT_186679 [Auricularia subglabra TFB-10046 SS5]|nr:hypothetical protein AURDEDRAFT_186679 [Auricularia subglabra TFB-10046 SS5]
MATSKPTPQWKLKLIQFARRLIPVGDKANMKQNRDFCELYIEVISNAMYTVALSKGDAILLTKEYSDHFNTLQAQKTRLQNRAITNAELREIRGILIGLQVGFIADSATQGVHLPMEFEALMNAIEKMPEGATVPEPYAPPSTTVPHWQQMLPGRPSQDIAMPPPPPQPRARTTSEYAATRSAYHHAYAAPAPSNATYGHNAGAVQTQYAGYPAAPQNPAYSQQSVAPSGASFQRGHARNVLSVSAVGGNNFAPQARVSTDRSSASSGQGSARSQVPMSNAASPYYAGGQGFASMVELPVGSYDQQMDPNLLAYQHYQAQGWRESLDQTRQYR